MKALKMGRLYECALCLMLSFSVIMATSTKEKADETTTSTSFLNNQIARAIKNEQTKLLLRARATSVLRKPR